MSWASQMAAMQRHGYGWIDDQERYIVGVDFGQARDYTAICTLKKNHLAQPKPTYDLIHLERARGVPYPEIVSQVRMLMQRIDDMRPQPKLELVVDGTGVGQAVVDLLRDAELPGQLTSVVIHGGDAVTKDGDVSRVPKRLLAGTVQVMLQTRRLGISDQLALHSVLVAELANFKAKINNRGHATFEAGDDWRDNAHDDLVLAVALALWKGENETSGWMAITDPDVVAALREAGV